GFTKQVQNLGQRAQPRYYWYVYFSYGGVSYFGDMETATSATGTPTFHYGRFDINPTTGLNTQKVLGLADAGTFNADGTITVTLSNSKLNEVANPNNPPTRTPPSAGSLIPGIHGEHRHADPSAGASDATRTVTDRRGQASTNAANADVTVTSAPVADLGVAKTGPATGHVGQVMTYWITVTNQGPDTATGVTVTDRLPK